MPFEKKEAAVLEQQQRLARAAAAEAEERHRCELERQRKDFVKKMKQIEEERISQYEELAAKQGDNDAIRKKICRALGTKRDLEVLARGGREGDGGSRKTPPRRAGAPARGLRGKGEDDRAGEDVLPEGV